VPEDYHITIDSPMKICRVAVDGLLEIRANGVKIDNLFVGLGGGFLATNTCSINSVTFCCEGAVSHIRKSEQTNMIA